MRKTKEICRLANTASLSKRAIGRAVGVSNSTVSDVLSRLAASGLSWQQAEALPEAELERRLYREQGRSAPGPREPDWTYVRTELARPHVTLQQLWQEYKHEHPDGYQYSWFCERAREWRRRADPVMRFEHVFGEKVFVDWAGDTVPVVDAQTGEVSKARLFVAVLGASNYTFVRAYASEDMAAFLTAHADAFAYFGGVPALLVCNNLKTGVKRADRYEPELNAEYAALAEHYGTCVMPARPGKPRDKAKVEAAVLSTYRLVLAPLRNRTFFSLAELNEAIAKMLETVNARPFKKLSGSRRSVFLEHELPCLRPLPATPYSYRSRRTAKVHIDYHVEVACHRYSVPHHLVGESVEVVFDAKTLEVYHRGGRVALHVRGSARGRATTDPAHMPERHREHAEWTPERIESWLSRTGPAAAAFGVKVMAGFPHPELGFRSCLGLVRLGRKYGRERLEAACARALASGADRYHSVRSILEKGLDAAPADAPGPPPPVPGHGNVRGPGYYA